MRTIALLAAASLAATPLTAQALGRIDFPNSGNAGAQAPFRRGVLLLHSFEYEDAARAFREAETADSGFALAYWGEALTYTHPLWNQQDSVAGRAALGRLAPTPEARRSKAPTARERGYLAAVEALYFGAGPKPKRDSLYAAALEPLLAAFPDDDEARAFYAVSLMGLSQAVRNIPTYMRAGAIAQDILRRNPEHPGALHYVIHAFDDPIHAPLGLHAARAYSRIAADADHAQHMTTHIFLALGMWPETIRQNVIAAGPDSAHWKPGHYTAWMGYGLLQEGKYAAARRQLEVVRSNLTGSPDRGRQSYMLSMRAAYLVNSERWDDGVADWALDTTVAAPGPKAMDAYAVGVSLLRRGRRADAERALVRLDALARADQTDNQYGANPRMPTILARQLRALLLWERGKKPEALALLRTAAGSEDALPLEFGPPDIVKPTHELLGELLLAQRQPAEAQKEFARALELAPGRSRALLGLSRAAHAAGDEPVAERALTRLRQNWNEADSDVPELNEVRGARAGL